MWLKQREMTIKKLERYQRSRDAAEGQSEGTVVKDAEDVICALQQQVSYAQDNINESDGYYAGGGESGQGGESGRQTVNKQLQGGGSSVFD